MHEINWICCAYAPKRGGIEKDCGVVWPFIDELGHVLLIWIALIPGLKGVKQCLGTRRECRELVSAV